LSYRHQLVASPDYLKNRKAPERPRDLLDHRLIAFSYWRPESRWTFVHINGKEEETLTFQPHLSMNDFAGLTPALLAGGGVGDLPPEEARVLYAVQQPFKKSLTTEKTTNAAWRTKPTFYAVSTQDRTINPDLERFMAKRMGGKTIEIEASHLALISHPDAITNLILEALAV